MTSQECDMNMTTRQRRITRRLALLGVFFLLDTPALAFKPEQTTLAEQFEKAQLVCVVEITKDASPYSGKILQMIKSPQGFSQAEVSFDTVSLRQQDMPSLKLGDKKVILLCKNKDNKWEASAYGTQAIWPKSEASWPYCESHIASLADTVEAVKVLSDLATKPDDTVQYLLKSTAPLQRLLGLEILLRSENLAMYPRAVAEANNKGNDSNRDVARLAAMVMKKANAKKSE